MDDAGSLSRTIAEAARSLQSETGTHDTLTLAVELAVTVIAGAQDAAISLIHRDGTVNTPAATSPRAARVAELQYEDEHGPGLSAPRDQEVVSCSDLESEERWDCWGPRTAKQTGVRSMLSFRLFTHESRLGALNLYSSEPGAFTGADIDTGTSFAAHTAIAIVVAQHDAHQHVAMDSRSVIGQATGILMERFGMDAVRAFAVLRRISQDSNRKLHDIALELIRTRDTPESS